MASAREVDGEASANGAPEAAAPLDGADLACSRRKRALSAGVLAALALLGCGGVLQPPNVDTSLPFLAKQALRRLSGDGDARGAPEVLPDLHSKTSPFSLAHPDPRVLVWDTTNFSAPFWDGWLNVPLVYDPSFTFFERPPQVCLRVRVVPARRQPARLGALLAHCGGPGSGHACVTDAMMGFFTLEPSDALRDGYDLWSISQRGVDQDEENAPPCPFAYDGGESIKPFPKVECSEVLDLSKQELLSCLACEPDNTTYDQVIQPIIQSQGMPVDPELGVTTRNETFVRWFYRLLQLEHTLCFEQKRYRLKSPYSERPYRALNYAGTAYLARDLETFREAIGAERLSVYGSSYGTLVGGVYATFYPSRVFRLVLDGALSPEPDVADFATFAGDGVEAVWGGQTSACEESTQRHGAGRCPAAPGVASKVHRMINDDDDKWRAAKVWDLVYWQLFDSDVPETRNVMACVEEYYRGRPVPGCDKGRAASARGWKWTFGWEVQAAVLGNDMAGRLSEEAVVSWWKLTRETQPFGVDVGLGWAVALGTWPAIPAPVPPVTNTDVAPVIIGNLHDPQTPYRNAQRLALAFPKGRLMTWQGYGHCLQLPSDAPALKRRYEEDVAAGRPPTYSDETGKLFCAHWAYDYLATGALPRPGHVCRVAGPVATGGR